MQVDWMIRKLINCTRCKLFNGPLNFPRGPFDLGATDSVWTLILRENVSRAIKSEIHKDQWVIRNSRESWHFDEPGRFSVCSSLSLLSGLSSSALSDACSSGDVEDSSGRSARTASYALAIFLSEYWNRRAALKTLISWCALEDWTRWTSSERTEKKKHWSASYIFEYHPLRSNSCSGPFVWYHLAPHMCSHSFPVAFQRSQGQEGWLPMFTRYFLVDSLDLLIKRQVNRE